MGPEVAGSNATVPTAIGVEVNSFDSESFKGTLIPPRPVTKFYFGTCGGRGLVGHGTTTFSVATTLSVDTDPGRPV